MGSIQVIYRFLQEHTVAKLTRSLGRVFALEPLDHWFLKEDIDRLIVFLQILEEESQSIELLHSCISSDITVPDDLMARYKEIHKKTKTLFEWMYFAGYQRAILEALNRWTLSKDYLSSDFQERYSVMGDITELSLFLGDLYVESRYEAIIYEKRLLFPKN